MDIAGFRKAGHDAVESIARYYEGLEGLPVASQTEPGSIKGLVPEHPPTKGEPFHEISKDFEALILPGITHWQHPSFFALYPANSTFESIIADMYSAAVNTPGFNWACSPIATDLEFVMMDWVADIFGLSEFYKSTSPSGGGTIVGTASEACLTVSVAARERALRYEFERPSVQGDQNIFQKNIDSPYPVQRPPIHSSARAHLTGRLVMYGSNQTHSMGQKSALILGLQWRGVPVKKADGWRLRGESLRRALEADVANGLIPCMLIATLGTTNVGAMDALDELVEVAKDFPTLWVHVDAAWAGVYLSLPEHRAHLHLDIINKPDRTFENTGPFRSKGYLSDGLTPNQREAILKTAPGVVNSFCTNLHKSGLVSFDCSTFFVRDKNLLTEAFELTPHYLRSKEGELDVALDFRNWGIPLGRRFRSLKIFFVLRSFGVRGFQAELRRTIDLTNHFDRLVREHEWFETLQETSLALSIFRLSPSQEDLEKEGISWPENIADQEAILNALNQRLATLIQATNQIAFTPSVVDGKRCFRIAVGRMSKRCHVDQAWEIFRKNLEDLKLELRIDKLLLSLSAEGAFDCVQISES